MRIITFFGGISLVFLPGCASISGKSTNADERKGYITQARIFHERNDTGCSISSTAKNESFGAAIASAVVPELIGSGIDLLSSALKSASRKEKESQEINSQETGAALYTIVANEGGAIPVATTQCVRLLVAKFPNKPFSNDAINGSPKINKSSLRPSVETIAGAATKTVTAEEKLNNAINKWMGATDNPIETLLYAEYEMEAVKGGANPPLFKVSPMLVWYPKAIHGEKYKLMTITMQAEAVPKAENPVFAVSTLIGGEKGLPVGTILGSPDLAGLQTTYVPAPAIGMQNTANITNIVTMIETKRTTKAAYAAGEKQQQIDDKIAENKRDKCLHDADLNEKLKTDKIKSSAKDLCQTTFDTEIVKNKLTLFKLQQQQEAADTKLLSLETGIAPDGLVNISFKINETTKPNKFLLALSEAISSNKEDLRTPLQRVLLGPQKTDQDRVDEFTDQWNYDTKLFEFNSARSAYELLLAQTPPPTQIEIDAAYDKYRTTGAELGELAIATGNPLPF